MLPEADAQLYLGYNSTLLKLNKSSIEALCKLRSFFPF